MFVEERMKIYPTEIRMITEHGVRTEKWKIVRIKIKNCYIAPQEHPDARTAEVCDCASPAIPRNAVCDTASREVATTALLFVRATADERRKAPDNIAIFLG